MRRGLVTLLLLAAVAAVVPTAALPRAVRQSVFPPGFSATFGAVSSAPNTYTFMFTAGQDPICTIGFVLSAARQTGVLIDSVTTNPPGLGIAPPTISTHPSPGFLVNSQVNAGQTVTVTFHTTMPVPAASGAELGITVCGSQTNFGGDITGPAPPPPPSNPCHCTGLTLKAKPVNFTDDHTFVFDVDYTLTCAGDPTGTCRGEVDVEPPLLKVGAGDVGTDWVVAKSKQKLSCLGRCGQSSTGELRVVGHSKKMLERRLRAGKTFEIVLDYACADLGQPKGATKKKTLEIVFDKRGFLNRAKSKF